MAGQLAEGRVVSNHPARELWGPLVFLLRGLSPALSRETHSSRVSHIAATRTGPPHARGNRAGTLLRRVQLKAKKTTTTMMTKSAAAAAAMEGEGGCAGYM